MDQVADAALAVLIDNADMLQEYFRIGINQDGFLCTLPELLPGHTPNPTGLPVFLLSLVMRTNWTEELPCFRGIATELAKYYAALPDEDDPSPALPNPTLPSTLPSNLPTTLQSTLPSTSTSTSTTTAPKRDYPGPLGTHSFQSLVLPALKAHLVPPRQCAEDDTTVIQLASLEQLYKVFERC